MKILFTMTPAFNPNDGGVQRTTFKLGKKFTELGHEVAYFSLSDGGNLKAEFGKLFHASLPGEADNETNLKELRQVLYTTKPDFVINQMPYIQKLAKTLFIEKSNLGYTLLGCLRNSLFSVKNNIRETSEFVLPKFLFKCFDHKLGLHFLLQLHRLKHKYQLKKILDLHDKFILLAPPNQNELNYFVGDYKKDKVSIIPNSIPKVFNESFNKENIILYVGRLNIQQKRSDLLLKFWKQTYNQLKDWEFIVVGDGPYMGNLKDQIEEENIPRIKLLGYQQPEEWYKKAPIFIMTSAFEGFPNVILEAQSYGCVPVVFKSYDAISWIVNDQKDALLCKPFDIFEFSSKLIELAGNTIKLEKMRLESKKNASQFVIDNVAEKWLALFEKMRNN